MKHMSIDSLMRVMFQLTGLRCKVVGSTSAVLGKTYSTTTRAFSLSFDSKVLLIFAVVVAKHAFASEAYFLATVGGTNWFIGIAAVLGAGGFLFQGSLC